MATATIALLRLLLQDASGTGQLLADGDYTNIISIQSDLYRAASLACKTIASKYTDKVSTTLDGKVQFENQQKFDHWMRLSVDYDKVADKSTSVSVGNTNHPLQPYVSGTSVADMQTTIEDTDRPKDNFSIGVFDNKVTLPSEVEQ